MSHVEKKVMMMVVVMVVEVIVSDTGDEDNGYNDVDHDDGNDEEDEGNGEKKELQLVAFRTTTTTMKTLNASSAVDRHHITPAFSNPSPYLPPSSYPFPLPLPSGHPLSHLVLLQVVSAVPLPPRYRASRATEHVVVM